MTVTVLLLSLALLTGLTFAPPHPALRTRSGFAKFNRRVTRIQRRARKRSVTKT